MLSLNRGRKSSPRLLCFNARTVKTVLRAPEILFEVGEPSSSALSPERDLSSQGLIEPRDTPSSGLPICKPQMLNLEEANHHHLALVSPCLRTSGRGLFFVSIHDWANVTASQNS